MLESYSSPDQETQLDRLMRCQKCLSYFKQPTTLSCGFTLCSGCLPSSEPYQCHSFSCLRTHRHDDYKPNVLLENISFHYQQNQFEIIKGLLDCSICLSPLTEPITTQCGHTFCKDCLIRTMTDLSCKACPFCRQPLTRIGKVNQIISGWLDYIYHNQFAQSQKDLDSLAPIRHIPILQVTQKVTFPSQHCIIHITKDPKGLLRQIEARPHQKHHIICVFARSDSTYPAAIYDHAVMLQINHIEYSPDNRHFVIQAMGVFRLRLEQFTLDQDDCYVGNIYRLDDTNDIDDLDILLTPKSNPWPLPTSPPQPMVSTSSTTRKHLPKKVSTRPRPCSMRLSSSAPNTARFSVAENNTPGSANRRVWAAGLLIPYGGPISLNSTDYDKRQSILNGTIIPNLITSKLNTHLLTENDLFEQELHPRITQFLNTMSDRARSMQYDWYLQQSDRTALVWWIANILPLQQEEKIHVLCIQSLKERITTLINFIDHLSR
ncbi:hypothetical protein BD560DRAFT_78169 [Blakeslea trispora]|nr:hypothetical protein BD560DRAFT_78169 [Blakeslea trispora]